MATHVPHPNNIHSERMSASAMASDTEDGSGKSKVIEWSFELMALPILLLCAAAWVSAGMGAGLVSAPAQLLMGALGPFLYAMRVRQWPPVLVVYLSVLALGAVLAAEPASTASWVYFLASAPLACAQAAVLQHFFQKEAKARHEWKKVLGITLQSAIVWPALLATTVLLFTASHPGKVWLDWFINASLGALALAPVMSMILGASPKAHNASSAQNWLQAGIKPASVFAAAMTAALLSAYAPSHAVAIMGLAIMLVLVDMPLRLNLGIWGVTAVGYLCLADLSSSGDYARKISLMGFFIVLYSMIYAVSHWREKISRLQSTDALFKDAMRFSPIGNALTSLDGRFTLVNESLLRMTGWSGQEMAFKKLSELVTPESRPGLQKALLQLSTSTARVAKIKVQLNRKKRSALTCQLVISPIKKNKHSTQGFALQFEEVQDFQPEKNKVQAIQQALAFTQESADVACWEIDLQEDTLHLNARCLKLLGVANPNAIRCIDDLCSFIAVEEQAQWKQEMQKTLFESSLDFQMTHHVLPSSGGRMTVTSLGRVLERGASGNPVRLMFIFKPQSGSVLAA